MPSAVRWGWIPSKATVAEQLKEDNQQSSIPWRSVVVQLLKLRHELYTRYIIQGTRQRPQRAPLKAGSECHERVKAQRGLFIYAAHYNPGTDSSPKMHKCMPQALIAHHGPSHQTSGRSPCAQSKAGTTPRAMASGDRSGLWTFIDARNVRFAREDAALHSKQAQTCIKRPTRGAQSTCVFLGGLAKQRVEQGLLLRRRLLLY